MTHSGQCPNCGTPLPVIRRPANWRQALWGGYTCVDCGAEIDRWGRKVGMAGVPRRTWTTDNSTISDRAAKLTLSDAKLRRLRPDLYRLWQRYQEAVGLGFPFRRYLMEQLQFGDTNAAVVVTSQPLRVAAYVAMFDCVAMLGFSDEFDLTRMYSLSAGSRLITANLYAVRDEPDFDLFLPSDYAGSWNSLGPLIADFVTDDVPRLAALKAMVSDAEWRRAVRLGELYQARYPDLVRDGRPGLSGPPERDDNLRE